MIAKLLEYDRDTNLLVLDQLEMHSSEGLKECYRHLSHIIWAHEIWIGRINGTEMPEDQWAIIPHKDLMGMIRKNFNRLMEIFEAENSQKIIHYTNSQEKSFSNSVGEILHHVIIHGQHHRAQIALLLRQKEIEPPATDLIYYLRKS